MKEEQDSVITKFNLAFGVSAVVGISALLVMVALIIFLNSGAYATVKQIRAAENVLQVGMDDIDTTSPIQAVDLETYSKSLPNRVKLFNDNQDFGQLSL